MAPATVRRKLMHEFHEPVQHAFRDATALGVEDATMLLLDLRDERAQKMAAEVADLDAVRNVVSTAQASQIAPVLIAYATSIQAAKIMRSHSKKSKCKFALTLPANRFRMIVVGSGGITWAVGAVASGGPSR